MNKNGFHPPARHTFQPPPPPDRSVSGHEPTSPRNHASTPAMTSHIQVAKPYVFQQAIEACFHNLGVAQAREDNIRLAGVQWIDGTRQALNLPVRTFNTAVIYYHKFRLSHADNEYSFIDAAAASLFAACKIEDTLKKSKDILCAAHNGKQPSRADHLSPDDPMFEYSSKTVIGLERLMLEASSFDFRNRHPQPLIIKLAKYHGYGPDSAVLKTAYQISLDLYRTFAPLKQSAATMAMACLELAGRLQYHGQEKEEEIFHATEPDYARWGIKRPEVMGTNSPRLEYKHIDLPHRKTAAYIDSKIDMPYHQTLLDLLELYTIYRNFSMVGQQFPMDTFLEVRIPLNEESAAKQIPRYTEYIVTGLNNTSSKEAGYAGSPANGTNGTKFDTKINLKMSPSTASPATRSPGTPGLRQKAGERGKEGTVRFMLNPDRERKERDVVREYTLPVSSGGGQR